MDFVSVLLSKRDVIVSNIIEQSSFLNRETPNDQHRHENEKPSNQIKPQYGTQVTVTTESDKKALKQARKDRKKLAKVSKDEYALIDSAKILGFDGHILKQARLEKLEQNANNPLFSNLVLPSNIRMEPAKLQFIPMFISQDRVLQFYLLSEQNWFYQKV
jgi:hypothetical protein